MDVKMYDDGQETYLFIMPELSMRYTYTLGPDAPYADLQEIYQRHNHVSMGVLANICGRIEKSKVPMPVSEYDVRVDSISIFSEVDMTSLLEQSSF
jgi:hypothetical protein